MPAIRDLCTDVGEIFMKTVCVAGPSGSAPGTQFNLFIRPPGVKIPRCVRVTQTISTLDVWHRHVVPALGFVPAPKELRLVWSGRTLEISSSQTLGGYGVPPMATLDVLGRLPSQGFSRLHQLMEHLLDALAPAVPASSIPPADDDTPLNNAREPIMHAVDAEISRLKSHQLGSLEPCSCLSCTGAPNSTLTLCGALLHCTDAAVVSVAYRVSQARSGCAVAAPPLFQPIPPLFHPAPLARPSPMETRAIPHSGWHRVLPSSTLIRTLSLLPWLFRGKPARLNLESFFAGQVLLHARADCAPPLVHFHEQSGALTLGANDAQYGWVYKAVQAALTPEGVAISSLLSLKQVQTIRTPVPPATNRHSVSSRPLPLIFRAGVRREDASAAVAAPHS